MNRLFLIILFFACYVDGTTQTQGKDPYVILVSFDGFRHDYVERFQLPNFKAFISRGAAAKSMIPSFPSKTFPNHYSIVTGLYPGHHGLVDNMFYDKKLQQKYSTSDRAKVVDAAFYGGTPIWQLAKRSGIRTASYFWVGSEVDDPEVRLDYYFKYDARVSFVARVDTVMKWLALPETLRPRLVMLYFSSPDTEAHAYGPEAPQTREAVLKADSVLGYLVSALEGTGLPINVLLTSDHGLTSLKIDKDTYVSLQQHIDVDDKKYRVTNNGTHAHIYTRSASETDSIYNVLRQVDPRIRVLRKQEIPERWFYSHQRVGDLLVLAKYPHYLRTTPAWVLRDGRPGQVLGVHGYDPDEVADMQAIFYAAGPNIRPAFQLGTIRNVDVYHLICKILKLTPPPIDGRETEILKAYRQ